MEISGAPRVALRVGRSSQGTPSAVDNSAPLQASPSSLTYRGRTFQLTEPFLVAALNFLCFIIRSSSPAPTKEIAWPPKLSVDSA